MRNTNLSVPFAFQSPFLFVTTDTYEKIPLSQREKEIGNRKVQRDLYSAFLIRNADLYFKHPDREKCEYEFEYFADMQDQLILKMKESGLSMRQCFGF